MGLHAQIQTFGDVAAEEDDSILSYFLKTDAVSQIESGAVTVVLGRKGSGKTALAKYFAEPRAGLLSVSLSLRDYPWGLHQKRRNLGASEIETYVSSWRYLIAVKTLSVLLQSFENLPQTASQRAAQKFLWDNYGGSDPSLSDILQPKKLKLSKSSFSPSIMGNSIGGVEFETDAGGVGPELDALTDMLEMAAHTIVHDTAAEKVLLNFDELDQGLSVLDDRQLYTLLSSQGFATWVPTGRHMMEAR